MNHFTRDFPFTLNNASLGPFAFWTLIILSAAYLLVDFRRIFRLEATSENERRARQFGQEGNGSKGVADQGTFVKLMARECLKISGTHERGSPGVQSRFVSTDMAATVSYLQARARQLAQANPWIVGRLKTHPSTGLPSLWIPSSPNKDSFFQVVWVEDDFNEGLEACRVAIGIQALDKDEPIAKLSCIRSRKEVAKAHNCGREEFILAIVTSHMIGELNAFYRLWGMMNETTPIEELITERVHNFQGLNITLMKGNSWIRFLYFALFSDFSPIRNSIPIVRATRGEGRFSMYHVNMEWVAEQKKKIVDGLSPCDKEAGIEYVSTADILSAWFFQQFQPSVACIVIDVRERTPKVSRNHMGNYQEFLPLFPNQYKSALEIRRAVNSLGKDEPEGSLFANLCPGPGWSASCMTGWHTRYENLQLPHCKQIDHTPFLGEYIKGIVPPAAPILAIFKTAPDRFGIMAITFEPLTDTTALGEAIPISC